MAGPMSDFRMTDSSSHSSRHTQRSPRWQIFRWLILIMALVLLVFLSAQLPISMRFHNDDFTIYWAAGKLNISGVNPYDLDNISRVEEVAGRFQDLPMMYWNPPWTMPLIMPLSLLPYDISRTIWYWLQLLVIIGGAQWTWRFYNGKAQWYWIAWLAALSFIPALQVIKNGQISALPIIGIVGYMRLQSRHRYFLAGMLLPLIAIKPHSIYLLVVSIILWAIARRKWNLLIGSALSVTALLAIALLFNPSVIRQYVHASMNYPPTQWATATLGSAMRMVFGAEHFGLQFVPSLIGLIAFFIYWRIKRPVWSWDSELPRLMVLSSATAAYGWTFDMAPSIIAIVHVLIMLFKCGNWLTRFGTVLSYAVFNVLLNTIQQTQLWFWWAPTAFAIWYLLSCRALTKSTKSLPAPL